MMNSDYSFSIFCLLFFCAACNTPEATVDIPVSVVQPPIPKLDPTFEEFSLEAEQGTTWSMPSGTTITIAPNAFLDQQGQLISGTVKLKYRELHQATDIYLSGIPLENGDGQLTTAGTFELRGAQNQRAIFMNPDHPIQVKLASFQGGDDYDFYQLDEYGGTWQNQGTAQPEINLKRKKLKQKIAKMKPGIRFPLNRKYMAFNYRAILDVYFNNSVKVQEDQVLSNKLKAYGLGWSDAEVYKKIKWKEQEVPAALMVWKNLSGTTFPEWTNKRNGRLDPIKGNRYRYHTANSDSTEFYSVDLLAVMPLKTLFAFSPEKWKTDYQSILYKINQEQERLKTMAEVYRTFNLSGLGIFNWDKLIKEEENLMVSASFSVVEEYKDSLAELTMVYITGDNKAVIKFPKNRWEKMNLPPDENGRIFCLLPNDKIGLYAATQYRKIPFNSLRKKVNPVFHFEMKTLDFAANSKEDFEKILGIAP